MQRSIALGLFAILSLVACGTGLQLKLLNASSRRPSNVAVYFTVDTSGGEPVPGLTAEHFVIYEDGEKVSTFESKQTILNHKIAASHHTLLLIDMSGSVVESKQVDNVVSATTGFTERVEKSQKVAVYAFDGSPDLYPVVPFTESGAAAKSGIERLRTFKPRDPSTNLNGAVVEGLKTLRRSLEQDPKPLKFGTLVVFTDGTDRASRVSKKDLEATMRAPENKDYAVFAIGVGAEMHQSHLEDIGRSGTVKEQDQTKTAAAFDKIAARIEGLTSRFYLLSYCSPSRAGEHRVRIEAKNERGSGSLEYKFKADGFGPNCDPNAQPDFTLDRPLQDEQRREQEAKKTEHADKSLRVERKEPRRAVPTAKPLPPPPPPPAAPEP